MRVEPNYRTKVTSLGRNPHLPVYFRRPHKCESPWGRHSMRYKLLRSPGVFPWLTNPRLESHLSKHPAAGATQDYSVVSLPIHQVSAALEVVV